MVFILDSSTSVGQDNFKKMLQFCKDFLHSANIDTGDVRVGIVSYSTDVTVEFHMNECQTKQDIFNAIDNIPWRYGRTNTADGLQTMHEQMFTVANGDRPDVDDIAIIVTDGVSNINSRRTIPEAEAARAKNIHIYAIGIGVTDDREVKGIASDPPEQNAFIVNDFDELEGLDENIFSSVCPGDLLGGFGYKHYSVQNMAFTTYDSDNDGRPNGNCEERYGGGWWYNKCGYSMTQQTISIYCILVRFISRENVRNFTLNDCGI